VLRIRILVLHTALYTCVVDPDHCPSYCSAYLCYGSESLSIILFLYICVADPNPCPSYCSIYLC
jgi:hypothetical protein